MTGDDFFFGLIWAAVGSYFTYLFCRARWAPADKDGPRTPEEFQRDQERQFSDQNEGGSFPLLPVDPEVFVIDSRRKTRP